MARPPHALERFRWVFLCLAVLLAGCTDSITDCDARTGMTPLCGLQNPEDLAMAPGHQWLLASQFASRPGQTGSLIALRLADGHVEVAFPAADGTSNDDRARSGDLGESSCPGVPDPAEFSPHGIDLVERPDAAPLLLVVNHGGREAIEFFEWEDSGGHPRLRWRGCVRVPPQVWPDDVAGLPDGGMLVTSYLTGSPGVARTWSAVRLAMGFSSGSVWEWHRKQGWRAVPGTEVSGPNGVAVNRDGSEIYLAAWGSRELYHLDRSGKRPPQVLSLPDHPDNLSWAPDGKLLVTGQRGSALTIWPCASIAKGTCALPFSVVAVDPKGTRADMIFQHDGRSVTGAATVAIREGDDLYLGTFAGDRITKVSLPSPQPTPAAM